MVVCKFFLQGNCRYGNNCKFDHPRNQNNYSYQPNQYKYQSNRNGLNDQQTGFQQYDSRQNNSNQGKSTNLFTKLVSGGAQVETKSSQSKQQIDPENLINDQDFLDYITNDFNLWLNSSMWKMSSYKYNKRAKRLPILQDISEEEVRYALFEAKKSNNYNQELQQFVIKFNQVRETIGQIANPNQQTKQYLLKYFHESEQLKNQFPLQTSPSFQKVNPFAQIIEKKQQDLQTQSRQQQTSLFQPTNSPVRGFLQQQQTNQIQTSGSYFFTDQNQNSKPVNPFTQVTTMNQQSPINNQISFPQSQVINQQIFPASNTQSLFNTTNNQLNSFNDLQTNHPFKENVNNVIEAPEANPNPKVYSDLSELNEQDIKQFKENKFTLGLIPHCPPTKQLCL